MRIFFLAMLALITVATNLPPKTNLLCIIQKNSFVLFNYIINFHYVWFSSNPLNFECFKLLLRLVQVTGIISSGFRPFFLQTTFKLIEILDLAFLNFSFRYPQKRKSKRFRFGEEVGHSSTVLKQDIYSFHYCTLYSFLLIRWRILLESVLVFAKSFATCEKKVTF